MKTIVVAFGLFCAAGPAMAASPFDGTWKLDVKSAKTPERPGVVALKDGTYTCSTCIPAYSIAADGRFHPVANDPYADSRAVTVVDPQTIMMLAMKDGRVVLNGMLRLSAEGSELTSTYVDSYTASGAITTTTRKRVSAGPAGAHGVSGAWRVASYGEASDNALLMTMAVDGDNVRVSTGSGLSYQAKIGGAPTALVGDVAGTQVSVRWRSPTVLEETSLLKGRTVLVQTYGVAADGKTLRLDMDDKETGSTSSFTAVRQ